MSITWDHFAAVELRVVTIVAVEDFRRPRNPTYKVTVGGVRR